MPFVRAGESVQSKPVIAAQTPSTKTTAYHTAQDSDEEDDVTHFNGTVKGAKNMKLTLHIIIRHWQG